MIKFKEGCYEIYISYSLVDGGLGEWSDFTECSASCGSGSQSRTRPCNNPVPAYGGKDCSDTISTQQRECNVRECPGNISQI